MILAPDKWKALVNKIDDAWEAPAWLELFDGFVMEKGLILLDEKFGDKVPEKLHDEINAIVDAVLEERYEDILQISADGITEFVNLTFAEKDDTAAWLGCNLEMLYKFIRYLATRKKEEAE